MHAWHSRTKPMPNSVVQHSRLGAQLCPEAVANGAHVLPSQRPTADQVVHPCSHTQANDTVDGQATYTPASECPASKTPRTCLPTSTRTGTEAGDPRTRAIDPGTTPQCVAPSCARDRRKPHILDSRAVASPVPSPDTKRPRRKTPCADMQPRGPAQDPLDICSATAEQHSASGSAAHPACLRARPLVCTTYTIPQHTPGEATAPPCTTSFHRCHVTELHLAHAHNKSVAVEWPHSGAALRLNTAEMQRHPLLHAAHLPPPFSRASTATKAFRWRRPVPTANPVRCRGTHHPLERFQF